MLIDAEQKRPRIDFIARQLSRRTRGLGLIIFIMYVLQFGYLLSFSRHVSLISSTSNDLRSLGV